MTKKSLHKHVPVRGFSFTETDPKKNNPFIFTIKLKPGLIT